MKNQRWCRKISIPGVDFEFEKEITLDADENNLDAMFFKEFFPCIEGHASTIDKFKSDRKSSCCDTVKMTTLNFMMKQLRILIKL